MLPEKFPLNNYYEEHIKNLIQQKIQLTMSWFKRDI